MALPLTGSYSSNSPNYLESAGGEFEEYDPVSGRAIGRSLPRMLQVQEEEGWEFVPGLCWLLPLPAEVADSTPLGSVHGLAGWRARRHTGTLQFACVGLDGRTFQGRLMSGSRPVPQGSRSVEPIALMRFPGDDKLRPVGMQHNLIVMHDPSARWQLLKAPIGSNRVHLTNGTQVLPPPLYWHCFRPRDEKGSRALRTISLELAQRLLRAAIDEWSSNNRYPRTFEAIKRELPDVTAQGLQMGVLGAVVYAAQLERRRASSEALRRSEPVQIETPPQDGSITDADLQTTLGSVTTDAAVVMPHWQSTETLGTMAQLRAVSDYFVGVLSGRDEQPPQVLSQATFAWELLVGRIGAVAYLAASPFVDTAQREALLRFLEYWKDTPFASAPEHFSVSGMTEPGGYSVSGARLERQNGHAYFIRILSALPVRSLNVLECAREQSGPPPNKTVVWHRPPPSDWDARERISRLIERVRRDGPFAWRPEASDRLAELTGMTRPEAALILAGFPNLLLPQHAFLNAHRRELLRLKSTEAQAARKSLHRLLAFQRVELLAACMPPELDDLWQSLEPTVCQVASVWRELLGPRIRVPDELVVAVQSEIETTGSGLEFTPQAAIAALMSPQSEPRLCADQKCWIGANGSIERSPNTERQVFNESTLRTLARVVAWLFLHRPVGDRVRVGIPRVVQLLRERLNNPDLLFVGGYIEPTVGGTNLLEALQAPRYISPQGRAHADSRDLGWAMIVSRYPALLSTFLRPSRVTGTENTELVTLFGFESLVQLVRFAAGDGAASMARRVEHTPVPAGGFEANPLLSLPRLVEEVSDQLKIGHSAAALYLQMLALSDVAVKNVMRWNAWSATDYSVASSELVRCELVVSGKRPRAGREIFLPGSWRHNKAPNLPMEAWKLPLYDGTGLAGRYLPTRAVHELFAAAWERIKTGDTPRGGD